MIYKAKYQELAASLSDVEWDSVLGSEDVYLMTSRFYATLHNSFEKHVPRLKVPQTSNTHPWINPELRKLKNRKRHACKSSKKSPEDAAAYAELSRQVQELNGDAYAVYLRQV